MESGRRCRFLLVIARKRVEPGTQRDGEKFTHVLKSSKIFTGEEMGVKKKLWVDRPCLTWPQFITTKTCAPNGTTSDITTNSADFGATLLTSLVKHLPLSSLISVLECGLSSTPWFRTSFSVNVFLAAMAASRKMQKLNHCIKALLENNIRWYGEKQNQARKKAAKSCGKEVGVRHLGFSWFWFTEMPVIYLVQALIKSLIF